MNLRRVTAILSFLLFAVTLHCAAQQQAPWEAPPEADLLKNPFRKNDSAAEAGKKIFLNVCIICHGPEGKGDGFKSAGLVPKPADFTSSHVQRQTDGAIFWKITTGRGRMFPYNGVFTEEQRWQLVNFIRVLGHRKNKP